MIVYVAIAVILINVIVLLVSRKKTANTKDSGVLAEQKAKLEASLEEKEKSIKEKEEKIVTLEGKIDTLGREKLALSNESVRNKLAVEALEEKIPELTAKAAKAANEKEELQSKYDQLDRDFHKLETSLSLEKQRTENLTKDSQEYKKKTEEMFATTKTEMENITRKILKSQSEEFTKTNGKEMEGIITPLKEQILEFKKKIDDSNIKQEGLHKTLGSQIENMLKQTNKMTLEADKLTTALKGENKIAGNWGEHILESILENSGLIKGEHYYAQATYKDENDKTLIPDFVVKLPQNNEKNDRCIVIDSKVSLVAYERCFNAENDEQRTEALKDHIQSIKNHIDELAKKNYETLIKSSTLDFVMMFVPVEPAFILAMQNEPALWDYAYKKKIVLVSSTNVITSLKLVENLWKIDTQNKLGRSMAEDCTKIYEKIAGFLATFESVGKNIKSASEKYEEAKGQLSEGRGNVVRQLEALKAKGLTPKKVIPASFVSTDNEVAQIEE